MVIGYINVLKQIAEVEEKGSSSLNEISGRLKMSTQKIKGLLEFMEGMEHIEKVKDDGYDLSSSCSDSCKYCESCGCSGKITVSSGIIYKLTEKGRRICKNQTD